MDERLVALGPYLTASPGTGGKLRREMEDFVVEELPGGFSRDEGPFTIARIRARNWENNRLVSQMAKRLRIHPSNVCFAGTKDKRAITTQYFSFKTPPERLLELDLTDVTVEETFTSPKPLFIGDLKGNRFTIRVRESQASNAKAVFDELAPKGGFPNFFGVQRFGAIRPVTHTVGRLILEGDLEKAVAVYLGETSDMEEPEAIAAREAYRKGASPEACLELLPRTMDFERGMLFHLASRPGDFAGALQTLPPNLLMMFIHAFQSYLYNRLLSARMESGMPIDRALPGDRVLPLDGDGLPMKGEYAWVGDANLSRVNRQLAAGRAAVALPMFGTELELSRGAQGELERRLMEEERITPQSFLSLKLSRLTSKGLLREAFCRAVDLRMETESDTCYTLSFSLSKGSYATSLLREFMKSREMADY